MLLNVTLLLRLVIQKQQGNVLFAKWHKHEIKLLELLACALKKRFLIIYFLSLIPGSSKIDIWASMLRSATNPKPK